MGNKDGAEKNWAVVKHQFSRWRMEMSDQTDKVLDAVSKKDYRDALHHISGYLEATIQQLSKIWFYTWLPKWALVGYLIFWW